MIFLRNHLMRLSSCWCYNRSWHLPRLRTAL